MAVISENVTARVEPEIKNEQKPKAVSEMSKEEFDLMLETGLTQAKNGNLWTRMRCLMNFEADQTRMRDRRSNIYETYLTRT